MKLTAIDIEKTLRCHLMACGVPESAIRLVRAEYADIVTVIVQAPHGTKVRDYSAFQLLHGKPYVVDEMVSIARWYHRGSIPSRPHWWHSKSMAEQWVLLWFAGFTLVVIGHIAKHLGWYK